MIYYIGYYNCEQIKSEQRNVSPAAECKMGYIISSLAKTIRDNIVVVSPAPTKSCKFVKGSTTKLFNLITLKTFTSVGGQNKIKRILGYFITNIGFTLYLLKNIKHNDQLIVYHSLRYCKLITALKKIKKCKLTLEVEEVYNDVCRISESRKNKEIKYITFADQYIFPTKMLNDYLNKAKKLYVVVHGTYRCERDYGESFNDGMTHILYAGTLDPRKGGAASAVMSAEFLPSNYHVHILGFGGHEKIEYIKKLVNQIQKKTNSVVTYDGQLHGEDYTRFVQKCHIGLSTQNPDADFNATSFPSKILSYMSNGLRVISIRIPAVETSDVGENIYYYDIQSPQEIAEAIMSVSVEGRYDGRNILRKLDEKFCKELSELL